AAIVHADLASAAPFASHNGIVARACERLVLVARGVDEKSLLVPEAGHLRLRAEYESNLRAYANAAGSTGVHAWLRYASEALTVAAELSPLRD
ncbi:MAG: oxidoreductase, partial [Nocardioides sp.]|nr:oxidoreductase [Nocardioides sp.]